MDTAVTRRNNLNLLLLDFKSKRKGTQKAWATRVGLVPDHVTQMKNGHRDMGGDVARRIEKSLGLDMGWMDSAHDEIDSVTLSKPSQEVSVMTYKEFTGHGAPSNKGDSDRMESVTSTWIKDRGYSVESLFSIRFGSCNMRPNYLETDLVLVNTECSDVLQNDTVYAFGKLGEPITFYRVFVRVGGGILLSSDNDEYPDETVTPDRMAELHVIGQVVRLVRDM